MVFKELYIKELVEERGRVGRYATERLAAFCKISAAPDDAEREKSALTPPQRARVFLQRWQNRISKVRVGEELTNADFAALAFPTLDLSKTGTRILEVFSKFDCGGQRNPTWSELARYVCNATEKGEPLKFFLSMCLQKSSATIEGKDRFILKRNSRGSSEQGMSFRASDGVKFAALFKLKSLLSELDYPATVEIALGDTDYTTIFRMNEWAGSGQRDAFEIEMEARRRETVEQVSKLIPNCDVSVLRWSELYSSSEFEQALRLARDPTRWRNREWLFQTSSEMYLEQWGFESWGEKFELSRGQVQAIVEEEIVRTAAQYRLEGEIVARRSAIQTWGEQTPKPIWPILITNYDGALAIPSIAL